MILEILLTHTFSNMERIALLIGNSVGLEGVKKDLINWKRFLYSLKGGAWNSSEIITLMNPRKEELCSTIEDIRGEYDFAIVVFSGHGEYQKGFTKLAINEEYETIHDKDLIGISHKQITVFDCCRGVEDDNELIYESQRTFSGGGTLERSRRILIRSLYEKRIEQADKQQIRLYSCKIGEFSEDTNEGGAYIKNLLKQAKSFNLEKYGLVGVIHQKASREVQSNAMQNHNKQTPQAYIPKCFPDKQLILSMNPNLLLMR
ncbi:hypothetical protein IX299_002001 [Porphyromonas levii]|nr:hypothetical protein [Porphyromonas levii]